MRSHCIRSAWPTILLAGIAGILPVPNASAATEELALHILGTWQPVLSCDGCNPEGAWEGGGATNIASEAILPIRLDDGDTLRIAGLGGAVQSGSGTVDCRTGDPVLSRLPAQTPIVQFLGANGAVIPLDDGGYNGTNALRLIDLQREEFRVPTGSRSLWGSWPDADYSDNADLCYFTIIHYTDAGNSSAGAAQPASSAQSSAVERELLRRANVRSRTNGNTRALLRQQAETPRAPAAVIPANTTPLAVHEERLLCRVRDRFANPDALGITRMRLAERLAQRFGISATETIVLLHDMECPAEDMRVPSSGPVTPQTQPTAVTPVQEKTDSSPTSSAITVRLRTGAVGGIVAPVPTAGDENVPSASSSESGAVQAPVPEAGSLTLETKLRILCRVQQRGMRDPFTFQSNVDAIAQRFADQWNMDDSGPIASALLSSALCTEPERISLEKRDEPEQAAEDAVVGAARSQGGSNSAAPSAWSQISSRLASLPPVILGVAGLTVITFVTLVVLLLLPLVQRQK